MTRQQRREHQQVEARFREIFASFQEEEERLCEIAEGKIQRPEKNQIDQVFLSLWRQFGNNWNGKRGHATIVNFGYLRDNIATYRRLRDRAEWLKYALELCREYGLTCQEADLIPLLDQGFCPEEAATALVNSCAYAQPPV